MADNELVININGDSSGFEDSINKISGSAKKVAAVSGAAFAGLTAVIGKVTQEFAKFDNEITAVKTLLDESSFGAKSLNEGFEEMRQGLLGVGAQFPVSIEGLNKALFDTVSAGVDAGQSVEFVSTAAKLGVAGLTDVSIATDGLTTATNAFGLSASNADQTAAKFFTAQKFGKTTIEELSSSLGIVAASANAAGVSFEEVLASVSAATLAGVRTNAAFTSLKAVFANVVKPTADAEAEAARLGIQFDSASLRAKGLAEFLKELTEAEGFNAQSAEKLFGSVEALNVIQALTGEQSQKFTDILGELNNETKLATTFNEAFETQNATLSNQVTILKNQFQAIAIELGSVFAPIVARVVEMLTGFVSKLQENKEAVKGLAIAIGVAAGGAGLVFAIASIGIIIPQVIAGIGFLITAMTALKGAVIALAGSTGIGLLVVAIGLAYTHLEELTNFMTGPLFAVFQFVQSLIDGLVQKFVSGFSVIKYVVTGEFGQALEAAKQALVPLPTILYNAAIDSANAFKEGRKIGLAQQTEQNKEAVSLDLKLGEDLVKINQNTSNQLAGVTAKASDIAKDITKDKSDTLVNLETDLADNLISIDEQLGDAQVQVYRNATGELITAAVDRNNRLIDIENQGFQERQAAFESGAGQRVVLEGDPLRELLDNPEKFVFGPHGFTPKFGVATNADFGQRLSTGLAQSLPGTASQSPQNVTVDIRLKGGISKLLTAQQNQDKSLRTSREII